MTGGVNSPTFEKSLSVMDFGQRIHPFDRRTVGNRLARDYRANGTGSTKSRPHLAAQAAIHGAHTLQNVIDRGSGALLGISLVVRTASQT